MTKNEFKQELIEWLYIRDGDYPTRTAWREAFIKKIDSLLWDEKRGEDESIIGNMSSTLKE